MAQQAFPNDFNILQEEFDRRQKFADALKAQAMQPLTGGMAGNVYVGPSITQGLAKLLQAYMGRQEQDKLSSDIKQASADRQSRLADTFARYQSELSGTPQKTAPSMALQPSPDGTLQQVHTSPAVPGNRNAALAVLLSNPDTAAYAIQAQMKLLEKNPGDVFGKVNPSEYTPESVRNFARTQDYSVLVPIRKNELAPSGQVWNPYETPAGSVLPDPNKPFSIGQNGPVPNRGYQNYEIAKSRAGAANVSVNTAQKPFLTEIGKGVGESVTNAFNQAQQANQTLSNVQQIRSGLGNAILGPGANTRVKLAQIGEVMGINGATTTEQLQNTRNVIQGLARNELAAAGQMRGQGQITENERKLLQRAESGQINELTAPELNTLLTAMEKTANYRIQTHNQNLQRLSQDPNAAGMVQYMTIPGQTQSQQTNRSITVDY